MKRLLQHLSLAARTKLSEFDDLDCAIIDYTNHQVQTYSIDTDSHFWIEVIKDGLLQNRFAFLYGTGNGLIFGIAKKYCIMNNIGKFLYKKSDSKDYVTHVVGDNHIKYNYKNCQVILEEYIGSFLHRKKTIW